jgi:predicted enzyme related to lactoylglutathione lyase
MTGLRYARNDELLGNTGLLAVVGHPDRVNIIKLSWRKTMNGVVHFEMPYDNGERMAAFYQSAFGWRTQSLGENMGHYILATTTESDEKGPIKTGAINGGFYRKKPEWPMQYPTVVIAVDNIKEAMSNVAKSGGKVLGEPMDIPGVGQYVSFTDTEGNRVSMLQPLPRG